MSVIVSAVASFFGYALLAMVIENVIFSRALGVSRLLIITDDKSTDTYIFCALLFVMQLLTAPIAYFTIPLLRAFGDLRYYIRPLAIIIICVSVYFLVYYILKLWLKEYATDVLEILPVAAFNCTVFGSIYLSSTQLHSIGDALGYSLGSSLGYFFAVLIISDGQKLIYKKEVPTPLRGMPIMLIYIGILALAIYGFSGHSVI